MTTPVTSTAKPSLAVRLMFLASGLVALGIAVVISIGVALAGVVAIGIISYLRSRRGKSITRKAAWLASVVGTAGVMMLVLGWAILTTDTATAKVTAEERAAARAEAETRMPDWMRSMRPGAAQGAAAADSMADRLLENRAVLVWAGLMGAVFASTMMGTIAGSFAWGAVMLVYRGWRGWWMPSVVPEPAEAAI